MVRAFSSGPPCPLRPSRGPRVLPGGDLLSRVLHTGNGVATADRACGQRGALREGEQGAGKRGSEPRQLPASLSWDLGAQASDHRDGAGDQDGPHPAAVELRGGVGVPEGLTACTGTRSPRSASGAGGTPGPRNPGQSVRCAQEAARCPFPAHHPLPFLPHWRGAWGLPLSSASVVQPGAGRQADGETPHPGVAQGPCSLPWPWEPGHRRPETQEAQGHQLTG